MDELTLQDLRDIYLIIKNELDFLKYVELKFVRADVREHLARIETIKDKLEKIINKG